MRDTAARRGAWAALLALPLAGLALFLAAPELDATWEHHPAHFWLVLAAAVTNVVLAVVIGDAARRRGDARLFLISLAFLAGAGFLALHALATPGVLLDSPNAGFVVATPVGLLVAAAFAAASSLDMSADASARIVRRAQLLRGGLLGLIAAWAAVSLAELAPLDEPLPEEEADGWLVAFAAAGIALYGLAATRYLGAYRRRPAPIVLAVVTAFVLLAEAMLAIALARNWRLTWWEWHLLMLAAFAVVALSARREWHQERLADLYLPATEREISVLFADLQGYTAFAHRVGPTATSEMVDAYFRAGVPAVRREGGDIETKLIGDAVMATFNTRGDQPDHPVHAVRAALAFAEATTEVAERHPDWPRFRVGVNTGRARVGVVGGAGGREYGVLGDAVNLGSRLEGRAAPGQVVVGAETYRALPDGARVEPLGDVDVKGRPAPVEAYVVSTLPGRDQTGERLDG